MSTPPPPKIAFRAAGPSDRAAVLDLVHNAYRGEASRVGWTTEADLLDGQRTDQQELDDILTAAGSVLLLAETLDDAGGADLVGCCHVQTLDDGTALLGMFAVRPHRQGGGVGRAIVAEAERVAAARGAREMHMHVLRQRDVLLAWYARLGYVPTGTVEPFPYGNERFGLPRRPDLQFVVIAKPI
jgi:GNAT superfamily N-acetyltransferase